MPRSFKKVLVADVKDAWPLYKQALSSFDVVYVSDEKNVVSTLRTSAFDLVLLRYSLSPENGLDFLKEIMEATHHEIPVILVLEHGQEKIAIAAMQDGIADYLTSDELLPAILSMSVVRALEHKKWQKIYKKVSSGENVSTIKDVVTDLYSAFYLKTRLDEEMQRSKRYHFPLTMLLFHIEQFRHINDHYGFDAGDHVLRELGQLFVRNVRSSDLVARVRDDHFALLMPHTTTDQARTAWDRMLDEVKNHPFVVGEENFYVSLQAVMVPLGTDALPVYRLLENVRGFIKDQASSGEALQLVKSIE